MKATLEYFQETSEKKDDFTIFYEQLTKCIKPGIYENTTSRSKLLCFYSTQSRQMIDFDE
jgi:HSP90 family molecular chaperone